MSAATFRRASLAVSLFVFGCWFLVSYPATINTFSIEGAGPNLLFHIVMASTFFGLTCLAALFGTRIRAWMTAPAHRAAGLELVLPFGLYCTWYGFFLVGFWPGLVTSDAFGMLDMALRMRIHSWYSYAHTLLYAGLLSVYPHIATIGVFQVLAASALCTLFFGYLGRHVGRGAAFLFTALITLNVVVVANVVSYHLDIIFTFIVLLHLVVLFDVLLRARRGEQASRYQLLVLFGSAVAAVVWRKDAVVLLAGVPLALLLFKALPWRRILLYAGGAVVATGLLMGPMAEIVYRVGGMDAFVRTLEPRYRLSLFVNPLGFIHQKAPEAVMRCDLQAFSNVVNLDKVRELSVPYEIPVYWGQHYNQEASKQDYDRFFGCAGRYFLDNLPYFLASRIVTFVASSGLSPGMSFTFSDYARDEPYRAAWAAGTPLRVIPEQPLYPELHGTLLNFFSSTAQFSGFTLSGSALFWNFLPALAVCLIVVALYPFLPATAAVTALILMRTGIVFLSAPAIQFKYHLPLYLWGLLVLFLAAVELRTVGRHRAGETENGRLGPAASFRRSEEQ